MQGQGQGRGHVSCRTFQRGRVRPPGGGPAGKASWEAGSRNTGAEGGCGRVKSQHHWEAWSEAGDPKATSWQTHAHICPGSPQTAMLGSVDRNPRAGPQPRHAHTGLDPACTGCGSRSSTPSSLLGRSCWAGQSMAPQAWGLASTPLHHSTLVGSSPTACPGVCVPWPRASTDPTQLAPTVAPFVSRAPLSAILSPACSRPKEDLQRDFSMGLQKHPVSRTCCSRPGLERSQRDRQHQV